MSDKPLTNAAVRCGFGRRWTATTRSGRLHQIRPWRPMISFTRFDRRVASLWVESIPRVAAIPRSGLASQRSRAHFSIRDVIAVRGQRPAAFIIRVDYGDGTYSESPCFQPDLTLKLMHRFVAFDSDSRFSDCRNRQPPRRYRRLTACQIGCGGEWLADAEQLVIRLGGGPCSIVERSADEHGQPSVARWRTRAQRCRRRTVCDACERSPVVMFDASSV